MPLTPVARALQYLGYLGALFVESMYWLVMGRRRGQPVRAASIALQCVQIGVNAVPIVCVLAFAVGLSLAIQLIATLSEFGAQSQVVLAIAKGVTREFGPLITGVLVAGRTASALAARIGSMVVSQEVDALRVIGVMPVRHLAAPALLALMIMMPTLVVLADLSAIVGGAVYSTQYLDLSFGAYLAASFDSLATEDVVQSLLKALVFGVLIALIGVSSGFSVRGGAEGVGQATTQAVVLSISALVIANMVFTFFLNR